MSALPEVIITFFLLVSAFFDYHIQDFMDVQDNHTREILLLQNEIQNLENAIIYENLERSRIETFAYATIPIGKTLTEDFFQNRGEELQTIWNSYEQGNLTDVELITSAITFHHLRVNQLVEEHNAKDKESIILINSTPICNFDIFLSSQTKACNELIKDLKRLKMFSFGCSFFACSAWFLGFLRRKKKR